MKQGSVRISKRLYGELPTVVGLALKELVARHSDPQGKPYFASLTFKPVTAPFNYTFGEGETFRLVYGEEKRGAETPSESTADGSREMGLINQQIELPSGTFLLVVRKYAGFYCTIYNVQ